MTGDAGWAFSVPVLNVLSGGLLSIGMAALVAFLWRSTTPARVGQAVFLATALFVLVSKVFSPQYTIWLIPLAVLARPAGWLSWAGSCSR